MGIGTDGPARRTVLLLIVGGLSVVALAATFTLRATSGGHERPAAAAAADPDGVTLAERDVSVVTQVYEPGHDSGWHSHPGIHAVAVLSGTLTVYDADCRRATFGPGQPYVGGRDLHVVRNESAAPVEMVVTYMNPTSPPPGATRQPVPPPGCVPPQ